MVGANGHADGEAGHEASSRRFRAMPRLLFYERSAPVQRRPRQGFGYQGGTADPGQGRNRPPAAPGAATRAFLEHYQNSVSGKTIWLSNDYVDGDSIQNAGRGGVFGTLALSGLTTGWPVASAGLNGAISLTGSA